MLINETFWLKYVADMWNVAVFLNVAQTYDKVWHDGVAVQL